MLGCAPFDERHNSANIAEWMTRELDNWQLSTVTEMIISDTAANQLGIFNPELVPDLPRHFKPSKCCCHLLQLCIGDCIFSRPNITRIVKDCRLRNQFIYIRVEVSYLGRSVLMQAFLSISATTWELCSSSWPLTAQSCYSSKELLQSTEFNVQY